MKQQKKRGFFTFICSLLPGAAEMHMGFMKQGISIMILFFLSFIVFNVLRLSDVFVFIPILIWFYGFFHARNLVACDDEVFMELQDEYIWEAFTSSRNIKITNPVLKKWGAAILIVFGVVMLWQNLASTFYSLIPNYLWMYLSPIVDRIPQVVISILIIVIGIRMIKGKKEELDRDGE